MKIKNVILSSLGVTIPAALFFLSTPFIISTFGIERFGYITLFWVCLSVSSILDFGISRSLTGYVASKKDDNLTISSVVYTVLILLFLLSLILSLIFYYVSTGFLDEFKKVPENLNTELTSSMTFIAASIPLVILYSGLRGVYEGVAQFKLTSQVKIAMGILMVLPLFFVEKEGATLPYAAFIAMISRLAGLVFFLIKFLCDFKVKLLEFNSKALEIFSYGSKIFISTFSSAVLVYLDRFVASYYLTPEQFGYYSLCSELIMRFLFIPGAVSSVSFQSFSNLKSSLEYLNIIKKAILILSVTVLPLSLILFFSGFDIIYLWTEEQLPEEYNLILSVFLLGFVFNSFAHIPYAFLQATQRAAFTAKLHVFELLAFSLLIYFVTGIFGVLGLLFCWAARLIFDALMLTWKTYKCF